jgi:hypothetical protein
MPKVVVAIFRVLQQHSWEEEEEEEGGLIK